MKQSSLIKFFVLSAFICIFAVSGQTGPSDSSPEKPETKPESTPEATTKPEPKP